MGGKRPSKAFELALSGIACAMAVGALSLGILSGWLIGTGYILGVIALMLPLSRQYFLGDFLAYLGTCILAIAMGVAAKFWTLVPFIMFFGLHPLLNALQIRFKINRWLALVIKALWFDGTVIAAYFLIYALGGASLPQNIEQIITGWRLYVIVFTLGTAVFVVYDYLIFRIQKTVNAIVQRIKR